MGAEVTVVGPDPDPPGNENGIRIIRTPNAGGLLHRYLFQPWIAQAYASKTKPDIVHIHDLELLQVVPLLRLRWRKVKVVYDVHEDFAGLVSIRSYIPPACKPFVKAVVHRFEDLFARPVSGISAVTQPLADHFSHARKTALYNFPSLDFYRAASEAFKPPRDRTYDLLHFGALSHPRASFLAETLHILHARRPHIRTCIAGLHPETHRFVKPLVPAQTDLMGSIPYDRVPAVLSDSRIGLDVHPFPTENLKVAVPVKVFEYMACRCAVVTSTMPVLDRLFSMADVAGAGIASISGGTPDTFADAVIAMLDRMEAGDDPGQRLRTIALEHYVWEKEASKLGRFYLDLTGRTAAPSG
jgi:glycosyltransferase involved in cell wall biosynthesis